MEENTITLEEVQSAIQSKELQKKTNGYKETQSTMARRKGGKRAFTNKRNKSRPRSPGNRHENVKRNLKCFICHREGHLKRDFPDRNHRQPEKGKANEKNSLTSDGYDSAEVLMVSCKDIAT